MYNLRLDSENWILFVTDEAEILFGTNQLIIHLNHVGILNCSEKYNYFLSKMIQH